MDIEEDRHRGRVDLLRFLKSREYDFVPPTPRTQEIVLRRRGAKRLGITDQDILGWSLPYEDGSIDPELAERLRRADVIAVDESLDRSTVRVARLGDDLFLHSAFPTAGHDAVFFGPDSYRFAELLRSTLKGAEHIAPTIVDVGTGSGVGAVVAARCVPGGRVIGTDINLNALGMARANAEAAGVDLELVPGDVLGHLREEIDVALANPPYIIDDEGRAYRDGGGLYGAELSLRMVGEVLPRLASSGMFILYTGAPIVSGRDPLREQAAALARRHHCSLEYRTIDPDVFGEELERPAYAEVDRIAVAGLVFRRG